VGAAKGKKSIFEKQKAGPWGSLFFASSKQFFPQMNNSTKEKHQFRI
jgi:hypothetical protein